MSRLYQSGGRFIAPIDRLLDPNRQAFGRGFLRRETDTGRVRARGNPTRPASIGDYGPTLYYAGADLTTDEDDNVIWPNRVGSRFMLTQSSGVSVSISDTFVPGDSRFGAVRCADWSSGATGILSSISPLTDAFPNAKNIEVALVMSFTETPVGTYRIFGTTANDALTTAGAISFRASNDQLDYRVFKPAAQQKRSCTVVANRLYVVHLSMKADGSTDIYINGLRSSRIIAVDTTPVNFSVPAIYLGAAVTGAAPMRIHELAIYSRTLSRTERQRIAAGYLAPNFSLPWYPTLDHVLDTSSASWLSWHPDEDYIIALGRVSATDGFTRTAGTAGMITNALGRKQLVCPGAEIFDTTSQFTTIASDPFSFGFGFIETNTGQNIAGCATNSAGSGDRVEMAAGTSQLQGGYNGSLISLATFGSIQNRHAVGVVRFDGGTALEFGGTAFTPGATGYTRANGSAVQAGTSRTFKPKLGSSNVGSLFLDGKLFFGFACKRRMSEEDVETVIQYCLDEHNV